MRCRLVAGSLCAAVPALLLIPVAWNGTAVAVGVTPPPQAAVVQWAAEGETDQPQLVVQGESAFGLDFTPGQGLGPLYNDRSCIACHSTPSSGGMGPEGLGIVLRVGRFQGEAFDPLSEEGGPVARAHSVAELGYPCGARPGIPPTANLTSVRNAPALFGLGLIDAIPDDAILTGAAGAADGVTGRPNLITDATGRTRVGRFGWKADTAALREFVGQAFRNELGITNPAAPVDLIPSPATDPTGCAGAGPDPEDDGALVDAVTAYVAQLSPAHGPPSEEAARGAPIFRAAGCAACHTPSLQAGGRDVPLYSDLLLHDVGPALDDGVIQDQATGREWRTTPLWGLSLRGRFLHDGRARSVQDAILTHGGEASAAVRRFRELSTEERALLLAFLDTL